MTRKISVSAPGRVCLFGEHQDYLGLSVVSAAISLRNRFTGQVRKDGVFHIEDEFNGKAGSFSTQDLTYVGDDFDYLRAVVKLISEEKPGEVTGATARIRNEVPLKSGLSSSAAFLVAWAKFLDESFNLGYGPLELGLLCYRAEREELGIPCGMMDQLSSSLGGILRIGCTDPPVVEGLPARIEGLVVGDTLVHKRTIDVHTVRTREMSRALKELRRLLGDEADLEKLKWSRLEEVIPSLDKTSAMRLKATVKNREIALRAVEALKRRSPDPEEIGALLSLHHAYLRDDYQVSHPAIERLLEAGFSAGALGGKLTGAGLGGCVLLLAPGREREVARAIRRAGGIPYIVSVDEGARREP